MSAQWWEESSLSEQEYAARRMRMVAHQIERRGIRDQRLLDAMRTVPRHLFVPERFRDVAYDDSPVAIGFEQTISQPYIVAYMIDALQLTGIERVLEIGAGSGYEAALLSQLCYEVYSIEIIPELAARAEHLLGELGYENVRIRCTDGYKGWPEAAPFDRIIISAAPITVPEMLVNQLATAGRMILPMGDLDQILVQINKDASGKVERLNMVPVKFVPMTGLASSVN